MNVMSMWFYFQAQQSGQETIAIDDLHGFRVEYVEYFDYDEQKVKVRALGSNTEHYFTTSSVISKLSFLLQIQSIDNNDSRNTYFIYSNFSTNTDVYCHTTP